MCAYHPGTPAIGSCSNCDNPVCNVCLVTKGSFLSGSSQICRLCIRLESASNTALAIFVGIAGLILGAIMFSSIVMIVGLMGGLVLWLVLRTHLRERAQAGILGK